MFLDDKLYEWTRLREIEKPKDFETLVNELYEIVEDYYKSRISEGMTYKEGTLMLNKAFKLWDMFILKLEKENYPFVGLLKDCSYKKEFMNNPKCKELYEKGL